MQTSALLVLPRTFFRYTLRNYSINARKRSNVRFQRHRNREAPQSQNPGLQNQLNLLYEKHESKEPFTQEDFEELETDFMDAGEKQKLHQSEIEAFKEKQKLWIVGRKYFKESKVNFLTWNDKEQIRHLHQTNPEEWTVEKLAEGFPALPNTIAKLLKLNWKPRTENRIVNHDKHVENNWKLLREGKLNHLPTDVINHALKFSKRKLTSKTKVEKVIIQNPNTAYRPGEYGSIIESYQKLIEEKNVKENVENIKQIENLPEPIEPPLSSIIQQNKVATQQKKDTRLITLDDLKRDIENKLDKRKNVDEYEKMILTDSKKLNEEKDKKVVGDTTKIGGLQTFKVETNKVMMTNVDQRVVSALKYPEKIKIPKEKYKRGFTYKVNDCYYDYDGEFLYRVPGMYS